MRPLGRMLPQVVQAVAKAAVDLRGQVRGDDEIQHCDADDVDNRDGRRGHTSHPGRMAYLHADTIR